MLVTIQFHSKLHCTYNIKSDYFHLPPLLEIAFHSKTKTNRTSTAFLKKNN
jgi:hypothetical protein